METKPKRYNKRPEKLIRKLVTEDLQKEGWVTWVPRKVRFFETDIFGIYDIAAWKGTELRFIQYTTAEHINERTEKIKSFLRGNELKVPMHISSEVWGLNKDGSWKVSMVR